MQPYVVPAFCSAAYNSGPVHLDGQHVYWVGDNRTRRWCYVVRRDGMTAVVTRVLFSFKR